MNTQLKCNRSITFFSFIVTFVLSVSSLSVVANCQAEKSTSALFNSQQTKATYISVQTQQYTTLKDASWQHRVLVARMTSEDDLHNLRSLLTQNQEAIDERRLLVIAVLNQDVFAHNGQAFAPSNIDVDELTNKLRGKKSILIGLDGGTKAVFETIDLKQVFAQIDGMPMRQRELRLR